MIIRSKTPLRLGLAGGGTDVSPFCDEFGGCVLNVTINMYSYCTLKPTKNNKVKFISPDREEVLEFDSIKAYPYIVEYIIVLLNPIIEINLYPLR